MDSFVCGQKICCLPAREFIRFLFSINLHRKAWEQKRKESKIEIKTELIVFDIRIAMW